MEFLPQGRLTVRITPDDVGRRVSVRTLTAPGERGARFTDTVGVLVSWADGVLGVTRRDGRTVRLAESAVVAAKVVPEAPARARGTPAASLAELTAVAARGWPATERERIGDWTVRAASGWTRRANSAVRAGGNHHAPPGGAPGGALPDLARISRWYAARRLPPRLQVATGAAGADEALDAELERRGWRADGFTVCQVAPLASLADRPEDERVTVGRELTEAWLRRGTAARRDPGTARRVLAAGPSVWFAAAPGPSGVAAAVGRCVVDGRWAGFAALEVAEAERRRGLATAVMAALARAALAEGASAAYLAVETCNAAARALYRSLGFTDHHHYHYRSNP